jgi:hypothetical protein
MDSSSSSLRVTISRLRLREVAEACTSRLAGKRLFFADEELLFAILLLVRLAVVDCDCVGLLFATSMGLASTDLIDDLDAPEGLPELRLFVIGCRGGAISLRDMFLIEGRWKRRVNSGSVYAKRERFGSDG